MAIATEYPQVSDDPAIQEAYEYSREEGASHNIAEICAFRQCPGLQTDTTFIANRPSNPFGNSPDGKLQEADARRKAEAAGVCIDGKVPLRQLASYPNDPDMWVSDKSDAKRVLKKKGWGCEEFGIKARPDDTPEDTGPYRVDPALVQPEMKAIAAEHPEAVATPKARAELQESLIVKHSGRGG